MNHMRRGHPTRSSTLIILACLALVLSGCVSLFSGVGGGTPTVSPTRISIRPGATLSPSPTPLSDAQLANSLMQSMTLEQKLGQMVIVEFYGSTLNSDLLQMIQTYDISGVLIENKNGNAQTRPQLTSLIQAAQGKARIPLFVSTDFEGGLVNELRQITGERPSEAQIGASGDPNVAYNAGLNAAKDLTSTSTSCPS
jgi:beta-N-acetylhexosaminidase